MSDKLQLLQTWMQRVWSEQEVAAIDELFMDSGRAMGLGAQTLVGPDEFKGFHQALSRLLKDFIVTIDHSLEQGDWISALITVEAKSQVSDETVSFTGSVYGQILQGQIHQAYNHLDFMGLYAQLGLLPSDCFEQGLSGCRVS